MGNFSRMMATVVMTIVCTACASLTVPVAVISPGVPGGVLRGTNTASFNGEGSFNVSNGRLSCSGSYNSFDTSSTITIPVVCNDGRKGIVIATRDDSGRSGGGTLQLNDGTTGSFIFGTAAAKL